MLLFPGFVTNGRSEVDLLPGVEDASVSAENYTEAGFFQDLDVVIVGVAHRPSRAVTPGFLTVWSVH